MTQSILLHFLFSHRTTVTTTMALTDMLTPGSFVVAFIAVVFMQLFAGNDRKAHYTVKQRQHSAVLITGASRGIGKTIAAHLSFVGYTVFAGVRSDAAFDEMQKVAAESAATSTPNNNEHAKGRIIPIKLDVTSDESVASAVKEVQAKCQELKLDFMGIINNAGINPEGEALAKIYFESSEDAKKDHPDGPKNVLADSAVVTKVLDTNVVGCFRVTKAFTPLLTAPDDQRSTTRSTTRRVILIGSYFGTIAGALGLPHLAYEASKFALEALADGLRRGFRKDDDYSHIGVSLIKPGNIQTDMNKFAGETPPVAVSHDVLTALEAKKASPRYYPGMVKGLPCKQLCDFFALFPTFVTDTQV
jgi:NAD(P)-dependent dehydrogenase (short-subunit alcohol dehydrogenase family)